MWPIATLAELKARYDAAADRIAAAADVRDRSRISTFETSATHSGAAHAELIADRIFYYVVTERGKEYERRFTPDPDELLYWFVSDAAFAAACDWEVRNRRPDEDFRRQLFSKQVELLALVSGAWAQRQRLEQEVILKDHPFDDRP